MPQPFSTFQSAHESRSHHGRPKLPNGPHGAAEGPREGKGEVVGGVRGEGGGGVRSVPPAGARRLQDGVADRFRVRGWLRWDAIPPATDPGKPSRPGARVPRSYVQ